MERTPKDWWTENPHRGEIILGIMVFIVGILIGISIGMFGMFFQVVSVIT